MDKRYQVFVSSTYEDLQEERKQVMQALLELDCIPCGMELFPASNEDQWSLIKRVIDDCDYYILIIGGRYGSTNDEGMGYTEMEYRYASEKGKPIIAFLHKNPDQIIAAKTEQTPEGKAKLQSFRELAQKKMTKYWTNPDDLGGVVSRSMVRLIKQFPAIGWVKADEATNEKSLKEILRLQKENEELKNQISEYATKAPQGTTFLAQGEERILLNLQFRGEKSNFSDCAEFIKCIHTWNELFSVISPHLINECDEHSIYKYLIAFLKDNHYAELFKVKQQNKYIKLQTFKITDQEFQIIKVQFKALGLIQKSQKSRSVKDINDYWTLTSYGDYIMTQLIAIPRQERKKNKDSNTPNIVMSI